MSHHHHHHADSLLRSIPDEGTSQARAIRRVVRIGCIINFILMGLKLGAGYFGHSEALFADGFHSLNDVAADIIMLIFVGISYRQPDRRFNYGYGKFETFSSFLMSSLLLVISIMIAFEAGESIIAYFNGEELDQPDFWTFVVVLFAICCKEGLYRFYSAVGRSVDSKALVANAWHHRSDALASVATLVGVSCAHFFGPAFRIFDPVASLVIACFIFIPALRLFVPSFAELMEHSLPKADVEKARGLISAIPDVKDVVSIRSRRNGHFLFFDIDIKVDPNISLKECQQISKQIEDGFHRDFCSHVTLSFRFFS
ncbi:MAG: cation diffusion facilitator family transporter [Lepagella sp.]